MRKFLFLFVAALCATVGFAQKQDVNGDGVVNIRDATIVQKYVNKLVELTSNQQLLACSVNTSPFGIIRQRDFYFDSGTKSYEYYPADEVKDLSISLSPLCKSLA